MFSIFTSFLYFFIFHFSETGQQTKTKIRGRTSVTCKDLRPISARSIKGFWGKGYFTTVIIDNLTAQSPNLTYRTGLPHIRAFPQISSCILF